MTWTVELTNAAARELAKLDRSVRVRVGSAIDQLAVDPRPAGCVKLSGGDDNVAPPAGCNRRGAARRLRQGGGVPERRPHRGRPWYGGASGLPAGRLGPVQKVGRLAPAKAQMRNPRE